MEAPVDELERTWELCQRIDFSTDGAKLERGLLEPTASLLGAETAVFRVFSSNAPLPATIVSLGISDSVHDAYLNRYFKLDPIRRLLVQRLERPFVADREQNKREPWSDGRVPTIGRARGNGAVGSTRARQVEEFRRYRKEFLLPNGFYHHLGFCFQDASGDHTFFLDYHRTQALPPFNRLDFARAKIVAMLLNARADRLCPAVIAEDRRRLSPRELEVAKAVALGLTNKEVGEALSISVRTVENHIRSIFAKLEINTRTRLAARLHEVKSSAPSARRTLA